MSKEEKFAIIHTGGKQLRVATGDVVDVELLGQEEGPVEFREVLLLSSGGAVKVGKPHVDGAAVKGELVGDIKGPKVIVFKYKRRKNNHRKVGHRQSYSRVKITAIEG
ncbi:MAG: 50S ribosomal protein L21 [Parachlamydiales bacterium]